MVQLTKRQKISLLTKAKSVLGLGKSDIHCICPAIEKASKNTIFYLNVFNYIPELLKYKPKTVYYEGFLSSIWYRPSNRNKRIEIINNTIEDIKKVK